MAVSKIRVHVDEPVGYISPNLHGLLVEHVGKGVYEGIWVGEDSPIAHIDGIRRDVVRALRRIRPGVIRWPGGCYADDYHWEDGVGPRSGRPERVNLWWGQEIEPNWFGTHEFVGFCRLVGAEPFIVGNIGTSGSPREIQRWLEYCNFQGRSTLSCCRAENGSPEPFRVRYWGIGNEAWGCGGAIEAEDYAFEFRRYSNYLRDLSGTPVYIVGAGPNGNDPEWTRRFFTKLGHYDQIHGFSAHYYLVDHDGEKAGYTAEGWYRLLAHVRGLEEMILQQRGIMDGFDPQRRVDLLVDEWGTWHLPGRECDPSCLQQQNTLRDALAAASALDVFNRHADIVKMANIAQAINVMQALIFTDGNNMVITPTYHVYEMYRDHIGGQSLRSMFEVEEIRYQQDQQVHLLPKLSGSASLKGKALTLSAVNPSVDEAIEAAIELEGAEFQKVACLTLTHEDIHAANSFDAPDTLKPCTMPVVWGGKTARHVFPPASATVLRALLA